MKKNDEELAKQIRGRFIHAVVSCDDGNVHVKFPAGHKVDAQGCAEEYADKRVSDGAQEGQVIVWLGEEMLSEV